MTSAKLLLLHRAAAVACSSRRQPERPPFSCILSRLSPPARKLCWRRAKSPINLLRALAALKTFLAVSSPPLLSPLLFLSRRHLVLFTSFPISIFAPPPPLPRLLSLFASNFFGGASSFSSRPPARTGPGLPEGAESNIFVKPPKEKCFRGERGKRRRRKR